MPMNKFSTLNYLINSYNDGKKEAEMLRYDLFESTDNDDPTGFEPSQGCINSILNFASQYEVLKSKQSGNIELNLN